MRRSTTRTKSVVLAATWLLCCFSVAPRLWSQQRVTVQNALAPTVARTSASWTSATSVDTALSLSVSGYDTAVITSNAGTTISAGTLNFELSDDGGTTWFPAAGARVGVFTNDATYALVASTKVSWQVNVTGFTTVRVRLNPAITGSATVVVAIIGNIFPTSVSAVVGQSDATKLNATVSQATGTNLHTVLDTGSTTAVTQATGTNLHAVIDSGSTTAVTQATASNLNAAVVGTGTAGSPAGNILTVQGVASMTKLLVTPDSVALPANQSVNVSQINGVTPLMGNGATGTGSQRVTVASDNTAFSVNPLSATAPVSTMNSASANSGVNSAVAAVFDDTSPTAITENSFGFVRMSANRNLYGTIRDAAGNERGANVDATNRLSVSVDNSNVSANIAQMNGVAVTMGNGTSGTGVQRVTIASDSTGTVAATESGTWTVQPGNTANTTAWLVQPVPGTTNGLTWSTTEIAASDNHANIKNGAGVVYHIAGYSNSANIQYVRLYNAGSGFNGCNSATNLVWEGLIPGNSSGAGFVEDIAAGITFSTGISICVTGGWGNTNTTNATASASTIMVGYK